MVAGDDANVTVFDPGARWRVDRNTLESRSMNTPYDGRPCRVACAQPLPRDASLSMRSPHVIRQPSVLVLNDGATFEVTPPVTCRRGFTSGEFVFNTALSGYQEVITDPSYAGQIISFTYHTSATTVSRRSTTSRCARGARAS